MSLFTALGAAVVVSGVSHHCQESQFTHGENGSSVCGQVPVEMLPLAAGDFFLTTEFP